MGSRNTGDAGSGGPAPSRRDRYILEKKPLGTGGFADVFPATERETGHKVAFKRLRVRDPEAQRRFQREIEVQRNIQHPHVMPVLDVDPLFRWYTMPRAEGSLSELLPRLSPIEVAQALQEAGAGLAAGHARQLTHRDVTPRNILALREPDGSRKWVIADWGLVRLPHGQSGTFKTEGPLGTVRFIAPEVQHDARSATARADIFSLGMVAKVACELREWGPEAGFERFIRATTEVDPLRRPSPLIAALALLRPLREPMPPMFLVWTTDSKERHETVLVRTRAGAGLEVLGRCDGLYVCDGKRLLEWRRSSHLIKLPDWESRGPYDEVTRERDAPIEDISLTDFDTGSSVLVSPIEPRFRQDEFFMLERTTRLIGGAGPFLFILELLWWFGGGAHGNTDARFYVVDARTGLPVESLSSAEFATQFEPERRDAIERYRLDEHHQHDSFGDQNLEGAALTLYRPVMGQGGETTLEVQFTFDSTFAGSDGLWSSYTRSQRIRTNRIPDVLRNVLQPPPALRPFLSGLQAAPAAGWSVVPDDPRVEDWMSLFSSGKS